MTDTQGHLAWLRTRMAMERSLMAWVRTAVSLIAFGFTLVQFLQHLAETGESPVQSPKLIGLTLIGAGVLALAISLRQYGRLERHLLSGDFQEVATTDRFWPRKTPLIPVGVLLLVIGLCAFVAVLVGL
jgi:putative membrane protein